MSEYQYYEFLAIDRPLGRDEMDDLRDLSTRAEITPTSFTNTYHWGNFKGDPDALMHEYFDAHVYVANWGTHHLMFRLPLAVLDVKAVEPYCDGEVLSFTKRENHLVLEFRSEDESGEDWVEGERWMPSLVSIRDELSRGDLRALYIAWLASIGSEGWYDSEDEPPGDDTLEPPVPPGLSRLSAAQQSLSEFLRVDDELIEVAAARSEGDPPAPPGRQAIARWVAGLPDAEKDAYLVRLLAGHGDPTLRAELSRRFREAIAPKGTPPEKREGRRTVGELLSARDDLLAEKDRKAAERTARERARREREEAEARSRYLDALAGREAAAWREVEDLIAAKKPKEYDRAAALLADLLEIAGRSNRADEADARIRDLRDRHAGKPAFLRRLDEKRLGV